MLWSTAPGCCAWLAAQAATASVAISIMMQRRGFILDLLKSFGTYESRCPVEFVFTGDDKRICLLQLDVSDEEWPIKPKSRLKKIF